MANPAALARCKRCAKRSEYGKRPQSGTRELGDLISIKAFPETRHTFSGSANHGTNLPPTTMHETDWMSLCKSHFTSPAFEQSVRQLLDAIGRASTATDRARRAAEFGGFMRRERGHARMLLVAALMKDLAIEPTQHVASLVMSQAFGTAVSTASLDAFALPGRDASEKHMAAARITLVKYPDQVVAYRRLYTWYCSELKKQIARVRGIRSAHAQNYMLDRN